MGVRFTKKGCDAKMPYDEEGFKHWVPDEAIEALTLRRALATVEDPVTMANTLFKENLPLAAMAMTHLAIHSPSEPIRYQAAKFVIERMMDPGKSLNGGKDRPIWQEIYEAVVVQNKEISNS